MKPIISVVIPAYNEQEYIEKTLISIKNQKTTVPYEIIVCDNNSIDNTVKIAKKYADKIVYEKRQGISFARNKAVKSSKGIYLVNTDADTIFPSDFIEKVYKIFKTNKYVGFTCGHWDLYEGKSFFKKIFFKIISNIGEIYLHIQTMRNVTTLLGWNICTPRWVFDSVSGFNTDKTVLDDVTFSYDIEHLGKKKYFSNIHVHSSLRRFDRDLPAAIKHYTELKQGFKEILYNLVRKSKSPYQGIFGFNIKKRLLLLISSIFLLLRII